MHTTEIKHKNEDVSREMGKKAEDEIVFIRVKHVGHLLYENQRNKCMSTFINCNLNSLGSRKTTKEKKTTKLFR